MTAIDTAYEIHHWIGGGARAGGDRHADIVDPATGRVTGRVLLADAATVDAAVQIAREAQPRWAAVTPARRADVFFTLRTLLRDRMDELAGLIVAEQGKTRADAEGELARALEAVEVGCAAPQLLKGEHSDSVGTGVDAVHLRQPVGVVAGITPFNFPAMIPLSMAVPAIAAGNAFVLKPSEVDPSTANLLAELFSEAKLPDGIFTVVHGDREAAEALLDHPDIACVSFVGSTPVAKAVYTRASAHGKRVQALGGAKNHLVVLPDADLDVAADQIVSAAYGAAGQRCMAVTTVVAVGDAGDPLVQRLRERAAALRVGPGDDPDVDLGPLTSRAALDRVRAKLGAAAADDGELVLDGRDLSAGPGFFLGPCLIDRVSRASDLYRDELFAPVLLVLRAADLDEAIAIVNDSPYGNGSCVFTQDGGAARRFAREVTTGTVGINVPIPVPVAWHPFGGWKDSRFGDAGLNLDAYAFVTRTKTVTSRWDERRGLALNFAQRT